MRSGTISAIIGAPFIARLPKAENVASPLIIEEWMIPVLCSREFLYPVLFNWPADVL